MLYFMTSYTPRGETWPPRTSEERGAPVYIEPRLVRGVLLPRR
jgi:hypothetical protein